MCFFEEKKGGGRWGRWGRWVRDFETFLRLCFLFWSKSMLQRQGHCFSFSLVFGLVSLLLRIEMKWNSNTNANANTSDWVLFYAVIYLTGFMGCQSPLFVPISLISLRALCSLPSTPLLIYGFNDFGIPQVFKFSHIITQFRYLYQ